MYTIEGHIEVRTSPELLLGQFGMYCETEVAGARLEDGTSIPGIVKNQLHGDEDSVTLAVEVMKQSGRIPLDTPIEHIETVEQAEKYLGQSLHGFLAEHEEWPHVLRELSSRVPEGTELTGGKARIWQERRYPTNKAYVLALGQLVADVSFIEGQGWRNTDERITGTRRRSGLFVPGLRIGTEHTMIRS